MLFAVLAGAILSMGAGEVASWSFDDDTMQGWVANGHLDNVEVRGGILYANAVDWDPFLTLSGLRLETTPWQYVVIRLRANRAGRGELFWTGETSGEYGGFSAEKSTPFQANAGRRMQDIVLFPGWQAEGTIRQLRLDLFEGARFEIDSIRVVAWGEGAPPLTDRYAWTSEEIKASWQSSSGSPERFAPPLKLDVSERGWVSVTMRCGNPGVASVLWSRTDGRGVERSDFLVEGGNEVLTYNIELQGLRAWQGEVALLGVRIPGRLKAQLDSVAIANAPQGPARRKVEYFGFEDALNRTNKACRVMAVIANAGGRPTSAETARLVLPPDVRFVDSEMARPLPALEYGEQVTLRWTVMSSLPGPHGLLLNTGDDDIRRTQLTFSRNLLLQKAEYVPTPRPVRTRVDVLAYYFPGWDSDAKWDCIRRVAPIRKPALGYYDESNPECVDWQIKWAVENGIRGFLVDWYWVEGRQSLTHWFEAYRKARYKNFLKVAIMWANHNPPGTHSVEDMRAVGRLWIDEYFTMPSYHRIGGKPAVFIWSPQNIRRDLGGSEAVKAVFEEIQEMAKDKIYGGVHFVAMGYDFSASQISALAEEGYSAVTTYHEWGLGFAGGDGGRRMNFSTVVDTSPAAWRDKQQAVAPLKYYPVVDTGWDSRPWHGDRASVIEGRTPVLFERLLGSARDFAKEQGQRTIILGPVNEWGEGSYIEPCLEYGFAMMESVRRVFGQGNPMQWAINAAPVDVGLGPYDFPQLDPVSRWTFDDPGEAWSPMMGVSDIACADGVLRLRTITADPALMADTHGVSALGFSKLAVTMQLTGTLSEEPVGQLFWASGGAAITEATSVRFPLQTDGRMHTYTVDLGAHARWRGRISALRFDPCNDKDVDVTIKTIELLP